MADESSREWIEKKEDVEGKLEDVRAILRDPDDDVLQIQWARWDEDPLDPYTTKNTLMELGYDGEDVREELMSLEIRDYCKTVDDRKRDGSPPFQIFEKIIRNRSVYIKFKILEVNPRKKIFCMSFHFARYEVGEKPYQ
ncbi:MAG: hypothetical protein WCC10_10185 [Tumebacillaceae bacterium]